MFPPWSEYTFLEAAGIFLSSESFVKIFVCCVGGLLLLQETTLGDATEFSIHWAHGILIVYLGTEFSRELIQISVWKNLAQHLLELPVTLQPYVEEGTHEGTFPCRAETCFGSVLFFQRPQESSSLQLLFFTSVMSFHAMSVSAGDTFPCLRCDITDHFPLC